MNYEPYELLITEQDKRFSFQSIGKKGIVEKAILFSPEQEDMFNLALVDVNLKTGEENDKSKTGNGDLPRIMATSMKVILLFLDKHPDKMISFKGNSEERKKLYQIYVNKFYPFIRHELTILGERNQHWQEFEENAQFERFIIAKKELNLVW